jgi:hypothetical protein
MLLSTLESFKLEFEKAVADKIRISLDDRQKLLFDALVHPTKYTFDPDAEIPDTFSDDEAEDSIYAISIAIDKATLFVIAETKADVETARMDDEVAAEVLSYLDGKLTEVQESIKEGN